MSCHRMRPMWQLNSQADALKLRPNGGKLASISWNMCIHLVRNITCFHVLVKSCQDAWQLLNLICFQKRINYKLWFYSEQEYCTNISQCMKQITYPKEMCYQNNVPWAWCILMIEQFYQFLFYWEGREDCSIICIYPDHMLVITWAMSPDT